MNPGVHEISMADYLRDPCPVASLSSSVAVDLLQSSPRHVFFSHPKLGGNNPHDDSAASDLGTTAHDLLLGGEGKICVLPFGDWRTNAAKEQRDEARTNGLTPILEKDFGRVRLMVSAAHTYLSESDLDGIFDRGKGEQTMIWKEGDAWCRARPDWMTDDNKTLVHFKSTQASAEPNSFIRGIFSRMGYDVASEFYERGLKTLFPDLRGIRSVFLVQEQHRPYSCSLISLGSAYKEMARYKVERAIELWKRCMATNDWPTYPKQICYAEPTTWELTEEEEMRVKYEQESGITNGF